MRRVALPAFGVASLLVLILAAAATAGTYQVLACSQALHGENNSWQVFNSDPAHFDTGQVCPPQAGSGEPVKSTGMFATDNLGSSGVASDGAVAGVRFVASPGTTAVGLQDDRYLGAYGDNGWKPFVKADGVVLETCTFTFPEESCSVGAPFGPVSLNGTLLVNNAETLTVGIECVAPGGCTTGSVLHRAWATLYGARVTLSEQAHPSITGPNGSLWEGGTANGFHRGVEQISFKATDLTGIARATVSVDGTMAATQEGVCDYSQPLPCKPLSPVLQVDTTHLIDGPHTIAIDAYNAAGNDAQLTEQIVVANQPPLSPVALKAAGEPDGSFVVSWSDPVHVTPIMGAMYQLCSANGASCGGPVAVGDAPFALPSSAGGELVRVWLVDVAGNSSAVNVASAILPAAIRPCGCVGIPPNVKPLPVLRVRRHVRGRRLTVIVLIPKGVLGPVHVNVRVLQGKKRAVVLSGHALVKHGRAAVVFALPRTLTGAVRLAIKVSAQGAQPGELSIVIHRPVLGRVHG